MSRHSFIATAAFFLILAAGVASAMPATGLRGTVVRGPITPVCRPGVACDAPAKQTVLTFARGSLRRSVTTDAYGRYTIALPAGTYSVRIPSAQFRFSPRTAVVTRGRVSVRNFAIDTGIR